jgi:hypothetical protein
MKTILIQPPRFCLQTGMPDGISNLKSLLGLILDSLTMEYVGIFYGHLVFFVAILYILWPSGIFYGYLTFFTRFGMLYREKAGHPFFSRPLGMYISFLFVFFKKLPPYIPRYVRIPRQDSISRTKHLPS